MFAGIRKDTSGAAAAEMALIVPLLLLLMFGAMETGWYFYSEHVVIKAVRDGARFASREGFEDFTCPDQIDATTRSNTQNVTRTDQVAGGGTARLPGWTDNSTVEVTLSCDPSATYQHAVYDGMDSVPIVTVKATVPFTSLFSLVGFDTSTLHLEAQSQAPVMGA